MRLTALHPPPPTPITLIFAPWFVSSLNEIRIPASFAISRPSDKKLALPRRSFSHYAKANGYALDSSLQM